MNFRALSTIALLLFSASTYAGNVQRLKHSIDSLLSTKKAVVGVSIMDQDGQNTVSVNGDKHIPLQSVFKFHIALAIYNQVDKGKLQLQQPVIITHKELDNGLYSPIRDEYPDGCTLSLHELIRYAVAESDNVACDVLLRMVGGPSALTKYLHECGIKDITIVHNEQTQQSQWNFQYDNWTTSLAATQALRMFYENKKHLLSATSHDDLWSVMKSTVTGQQCIRGYLPEQTVVAHKTGHSGKNKDGITGAQNDIGIVFLPDGRYFYISILVSKSAETEETNQDIIATISKMAWDYFQAQHK